MKPFFLSAPHYLIPILALIIFSKNEINAQTTLSAGDMAVVGYNYDNSPQQIAIVTFVDIAAGTTIYISDYGYDEATSTFGTTSVANNTEGAITWTTTSSIAKGTLIPFTITSGTTPSVSGLPGTVSISGWTNTLAASSPSAAGGDNWFIYQGTSPTAVSTFVFLWGNAFTSTFNSVAITPGQFVTPGTGAQPNNQVTYLPASLTIGTNAVALTTSTYHGDNNVYTGITTGTKAQLAAAVSDKSNWVSNETTTYDLSPGGSNFAVNPSFTVTGTLPVNLISFTAGLQNRDVKLSWKVSDVVNFSHFEIERSSNGNDFINAGSQVATGPAGEQNYEFTDRNIPSNIFRFYYRLKMIDADGKFGYSRTVIVQMSKLTRMVLSVQPNPFSDHLDVSVNLSSAKVIFVRLLDFSGKTIINKQVTVFKGFSTQTLGGLSSLKRGTYLLQISDGIEVETEKIVRR
jgi:Secretion system C-terminal sorting domain